MKRSEAKARLWEFVLNLNHTDEDIMFFVENTLGMLPPSKKVSCEEANNIYGIYHDTLVYKQFHVWDDEGGTFDNQI